MGERASEAANVRRATAALSFCLPGLGHLYAGRPLRGFAVNAAFLLLLSNASTRLLVPVAAIFAAWEAGRLPMTVVAYRPGRVGLFSLAGGVGLFLWAVVVFGEMTPLRAVQRTRSTVLRAGRECARSNGFDADCVGRFVDGWGRKLVLGFDGHPRSAGKDGVHGTFDDVTFRTPVLAPVPGAFDEPVKP